LIGFVTETFYHSTNHSANRLEPFVSWSTLQARSYLTRCSVFKDQVVTAMFLVVFAVVQRRLKEYTMIRNRIATCIFFQIIKWAAYFADALRHHAKYLRDGQRKLPNNTDLKILDVC
jgi:hypothetical protein